MLLVLYVCDLKEHFRKWIQENPPKEKGLPALKGHCTFNGVGRRKRWLVGGPEPALPPRHRNYPLYYAAFLSLVMPHFSQTYL